MILHKEGNRMIFDALGDIFGGIFMSILAALGLFG